MSGVKAGKQKVQNVDLSSSCKSTIIWQIRMIIIIWQIRMMSIFILWIFWILTNLNVRLKH